MNKRDKKHLENIKNNLKVSTKAENIVIEHLFKRDMARQILMWDYGTIRESNGWVLIEVTTNNSTYSFSELAGNLEKGDEGDLWSKIK